MVFTPIQKKGAYAKLSLERQNLIMSQETTNLISELLNSIQLSEEQKDLADSEVLYAMLGLQPLSIAISNIASMSGKSTNNLSALKSELEEKIFSKIKTETSVEKPKDNFASKLGDNKSRADSIRNSTNTEEVGKRLKELPTNLQSFFNTGTWKQSVTKIGTQLNLKEEQVKKLETEISLVLICLEPPSDFVENLKSGVGVDESIARTISNYINGTVFGVVMKDIKQAWAPTNSNSTQNSVPTTPSIQISKEEEGQYSQINTENMEKAMRPIGIIPDNLPTENHTENTPRVIHNYGPKSDPYRELPE